MTFKISTYTHTMGWETGECCIYACKLHCELGESGGKHCWVVQLCEVSVT